MTHLFPLRILVLLCLFLMAGCAPEPEIRGLKSDGCSLFPDGTVSDRAKWCECCFAHDIAYWRGGTREERKTADRKLRRCLLDRTGDKALVDLMYHGARVVGHAGFPTWYRWACGWEYGRGYRRLSGEERRSAREKLEEYLKGHPAGYCASSIK